MSTHQQQLLQVPNTDAANRVDGKVSVGLAHVLQQFVAVRVWKVWAVCVLPGPDRRTGVAAPDIDAGMGAVMAMYVRSSRAVHAQSCTARAGTSEWKQAQSCTARAATSERKQAQSCTARAATSEWKQTQSCTPPAATSEWKQAQSCTARAATSERKQAQRSPAPPELPHQNGSRRSPAPPELPHQNGSRRSPALAELPHQNGSRRSVAKHAGKPHTKAALLRVVRLRGFAPVHAVQLFGFPYMPCGCGPPSHPLRHGCSAFPRPAHSRATAVWLSLIAGGAAAGLCLTERIASSPLAETIDLSTVLRVSVRPRRLDSTRSCRCGAWSERDQVVLVARACMTRSRHVAIQPPPAPPPTHALPHLLCKVYVAVAGAVQLRYDRDGQRRQRSGGVGLDGGQRRRQVRTGLSPLAACARTGVEVGVSRGAEARARGTCT
eukprot:365156-Chlamydomonas_euryale.AAC.1